MKKTFFHLLFILAVHVSAFAADTGRTFPAQSPIPASVTLLPFDGKVGRENPFFHNYHPELRAANARSGVSCTVDLGRPEAKVEPGETRSAVLRCQEPLVVRRLPGEFDLVEGGKKVGSASVGK